MTLLVYAPPVSDEYIRGGVIVTAGRVRPRRRGRSGRISLLSAVAKTAPLALLLSSAALLFFRCPCPVEANIAAGAPLRAWRWGRRRFGGGGGATPRNPSTEGDYSRIRGGEASEGGGRGGVDSDSSSEKKARGGGDNGLLRVPCRMVLADENRPRRRGGGRNRGGRRRGRWEARGASRGRRARAALPDTHVGQGR